VDRRPDSVSAGAREGQDLGVPVSGKHGMFKVRRGGTVGRHDRPAISQRSCRRPTQIDHRFDREGHPGFDPIACVRPPVVGDLRLFVHRPADAVSDHLTHHTETGILDVLLDRAGDVADPVADHGLPDTDPQRFLGDSQ
jgi:hypothetical protein